MTRNNKSLLEKITKRLLEVGNPQKIVLFGSRSTNTAKVDSDYDFLIIEPSSEPRYKRAAKYRQALRDFRISKDILVWTPEEVNEWRQVPNAFITEVLQQGIVLYER